MPSDAPTPGSPADWIRHAKADLALAQVPLPEASFYELLCFHAQQAAEKSIKAVLIHRGIAFPKTHILERLVDMLPKDVFKIRELSQVANLSVYATVLRYPGDVSEPVNEEEYLKAVTLAQAVVQWAEALLQASETQLPLFRRTSE